MTSDHRVRLTWHGAAHYQISYKNLKTVIDPLYNRLPGDKPQSQYLIQRFQPGVTMVHHFDNFMNPFTLSKYMNLESYGKVLHERCPGAKLYFSKFLRETDLTKIIDA